MAKSLLETKTAGLNAATSALNAQKGMLEVQGKMPSESQNTIDLYSKMRGSVGYEKQPRSKWRALLDGIFTGLEFAEKSKMTKEMKQRYETLLKGSEWIGSNLESMNQTMAAETKKAEMTEKISQFADPLYQAKINGADRAYIDDMGRLAFNSLSDMGIIPPGAVYRTIDPETMTAMYKNPDGSDGYKDLTPYISEKGMEVTKQKIDQMGAEARQTQADASMMRAETEATHKPTELHERTRRNDIAEKNATIKLEALGLRNIKEIVPVLRSINKGIHLADEVMADAKAHPDVFRSALSAWVKTGGDSGAFSLWVQDHLIPTQKKGDIDAAMRVTKNLNQLMLTEIKGFGGANNMTIDQMVKEGNVNNQYSTENIMYMLGQAKREMQFSERLYRDALNSSGGSPIGQAYDIHKKGYEEDVGEMRQEINARDDIKTEIQHQAGKTTGATQTLPGAVVPAPGSNTGQSGGYTKMTKPDGTPVAVSVDKVYEKMLEGYQPIK